MHFDDVQDEELSPLPRTRLSCPGVCETYLYSVRVFYYYFHIKRLNEA